MDRIKELIHDNQVRINLIKDILEIWGWELENGYAKKILESKLEAYININKNLE